MNIADTYFTYPLVLWVGIFITGVFLYLFLKSEISLSLSSSASDDMAQVFGTGKISHVFRALLLMMIGVLFSILLAGPYQLGSDIEIKKDGIDIVIVMDVSGSMNFSDFQPSRMEIAKSTLRDFISEISSDRVGLIVFAGKPISSQGLTFDYPIIDETISLLSTDIIDQNIPGLSGTNIGDALLLSKSLFDTPDREKVVILITDGDANSGADPSLSAQVLSEENITVYPIGIGKDSESEIIINNGFFNQKQVIAPLNTKILQEVADVTGGVFFRAGDNDTLTAIFEKLKQLQTSEIITKSTQYKTDFYTPFVYMLIVCMLILSFIELIHPRCK